MKERTLTEMLEIAGISQPTIEEFMDVVMVAEAFKPSNDETLEFIKDKLIGKKINYSVEGLYGGRGQRTITIVDVEKQHYGDDYSIEVEGIQMMPNKFDSSKQDADHPYGSRSLTMAIKKLLGDPKAKVKWTEAGQQTKKSLSLEIRLSA